MLSNLDLNEIIIKYAKENGLFRHNIESMNAFYTEGLNLILTKIFKIEKSVAASELDSNINIIKFEIIFNKVELKAPHDETGMRKIFPADARVFDKSYTGNLLVDITVRATAYYKNGEVKVKEDNLDGHKIVDLPIMTGSKLCNTYGMDENAKKEIGEDPIDPQGIFIVNGTEWIINNLVTRKYNLWHMFHNEHDEHARVEYISIPGNSFENSAEVIIKYRFGGEITFCFTSDKYLKGVNLPFYVVLTLFGLSSDKLIIENIIPETGEELYNKMRDILANAIRMKYAKFNENLRAVKSPAEIKNILVHEIATQYVESLSIVGVAERQKKIEKNKKILDVVLMQNFDINVLPHEGKAPENRFKKALFLCMGVRRLLECYFDIIPSTNRDTQENKRLQTPGDSFAKLLKKTLNQTLVKNFKNSLNDLVKSSRFVDIDLESFCKSCFKDVHLQKEIISGLNQGMSTKIVNGVKQKNRVPAENVKRKNHLQVINNCSVQRTSNTSQIYSNERNHEIRDVNPDQIGSSCLFQTGEGQNVGMVQNTTMGPIISKASSPEIFEHILLNCGIPIIPWNIKIGEGIISYNYTKVYINGKWIGYSADPAKLYKYFVCRRRGFNIDGTRIENEIMDRYITINWNQRMKELDFRTDRGRRLVPFVIIYNSFSFALSLSGTEKEKKEKFEQYILLKKEDLKRSPSELFKDGIIEYIDAEEFNLLVCAESLELLELEKNNIYKIYTHLIIPGTLMSVTSAYTPFPGSSPPTRMSLAGNHIRQGCSLYALNVHTRFDKLGYYQKPLVSTIANHFVPVNGLNVWMHITAGYDNTEDSLAISKAFCESGMFRIVKFSFEKVVCEKNEEFTAPVSEKTENIHLEKNYSKLNQYGFIEIGQKIVKNDVIIGKVLKYDEITSDGKFYRDMSIAYEDEEEAYVHDVVTGVDTNYMKFIKMRFLIVRPMSAGQKMASRCGQKGMTSIYLPKSRLPFTSDGRTPHLILNPHAFPSRLTINQCIEYVQAFMATKYGIIIDGSFMATVDPTTGIKLEAAGANRFAKMTVYNPSTGEPLECAQSVGYSYYSRLQKFSQEQQFTAANNGQRNFATFQPVSGKANLGGLKMGEMEKDNSHSLGATRSYSEKIFYDCDGLYTYYCVNCFYPAIANRNEKIAYCKKCKEKGIISEVKSRHAANIISEHFRGLGVNIKYIPEPYRIEH
jgi:DNA-directed RNA polymerase beta subunit